MDQLILADIICYTLTIAVTVWFTIMTQIIWRSSRSKKQKPDPVVKLPEYTMLYYLWNEARLGTSGFPNTICLKINKMMSQDPSLRIDETKEIIRLYTEQRELRSLVDEMRKQIEDLQQTTPESEG